MSMCQPVCQHLRRQLSSCLLAMLARIGGFEGDCGHSHISRDLLLGADARKKTTPGIYSSSKRLLGRPRSQFKGDREWLHHWPESCNSSVGCSHRAIGIKLPFLRTDEQSTFPWYWKTLPDFHDVINLLVDPSMSIVQALHMAFRWFTEQLLSQTHPPQSNAPLPTARRGDEQHMLVPLSKDVSWTDEVSLLPTHPFQAPVNSSSKAPLLQTPLRPTVTNKPGRQVLSSTHQSSFRPPSSSSIAIGGLLTDSHHGPDTQSPSSRFSTGTAYVSGPSTSSAKGPGSSRRRARAEFIF